MSNTSMPGEPATGQPQPAKRSVDAELVRAAVDRMEAAIARERSILDRLRTGLAALAEIVAQAKIAVHRGAVKSGAAADRALFDTAALLDELEHRVDAMREIGAHPEQDSMASNEPPAPQPDRVPTVSGVVSRLGRAGGEPVEEPAQSAVVAAERDVSNAAMLEAMVLALAALDVLNPRDAQQAGAAGTAVSGGASAPTEDAAGMPAPGKTILPENELITAVRAAAISPNSPPAPAALPAPPPDPRTSSDKPPAAPRPDPLAPLRAMTDAEKIALFS